MIGYLFFIFIMADTVRDRANIEVSQKFSKSNIKKTKKSLLNFLFFNKFHSMRNLGTWYYLNYICFFITLINILIFVIFKIIAFESVAHILFFTMSYIFVTAIHLVANVKSTKEAFKLKGATINSIRLSITLSSVLDIVSLVCWGGFVYMWFYLLLL